MYSLGEMGCLRCKNYYLTINVDTTEATEFWAQNQERTGQANSNHDSDKSRQLFAPKQQY